MSAEAETARDTIEAFDGDLFRNASLLGVAVSTSTSGNEAAARKSGSELVLDDVQRPPHWASGAGQEAATRSDVTA